MENEDAGNENTLSLVDFVFFCLSFFPHLDDNRNNADNDFKSFGRDVRIKKTISLFMLFTDDELALVLMKYAFRASDINLEVCINVANLPTERTTLFHRTKFNFRTKTIIELRKCDSHLPDFDFKL